MLEPRAPCFYSDLHVHHWYFDSSLQSYNVVKKDTLHPLEETLFILFKSIKQEGTVDKL